MATSSFSSSRGTLGKVPPTSGDLIINSLEDLNGSDFKRFRNKLSDFSYGDKRPIPRGRLERADCITTKEVLIGTYGEEGALDVTIHVFTLIGLLGPAKKLQKRRAQKTEYITLLRSAPGVLGKGPQTPGDLIIYSLEDLKGCDFKRFRNKLSDFSYGDKHPIPRGRLENADCLITKNLLIDAYGEEGALDVTIHVFTLIDLMGPANDLQKRRAQNGHAAPDPITLQLPDLFCSAEPLRAPGQSLYMAPPPSNRCPGKPRPRLYVIIKTFFKSCIKKKVKKNLEMLCTNFRVI
ncbi:uncharacterized protein [Aquarana catesbeiana]|uniref:uncharacterized protein isoform X2 n=1 Tax=Aquarana catesbeiana TaxID=8400 RepID=UPI003CC9F277